MDTSKVYQDSAGNDCTIWQMIQSEPNWAANRLQEGEKAIELLADTEKALDYFRSAFLGLTPDFVPARVRLLVTVRGDGPFRSTCAAAGEHPCKSNRYGAISVTAENGKLLGVKPHEFVPLEWVKNPQATFSPDEVRCKCLSPGPVYCPVHAASRI